jgi:NAD(P)-dependent dehydrogenase (short-subunit alcohol dehydrogenase family)
VETTRALAAHGAHVVMGVRDLDKGEGAAAGIRAAVPGARLELREVDLASLASVRKFTDALAEDHDHLDGLIANAGVMACPFGQTADGFETQFGTNHLGHFVLVNRLVPLLVAGAPSRVVMVSSGGHRLGEPDLDDPGFERTEYDKWVAYGRSKTANVQFAVELDRRLRDRGVRAFAVHPGVIATELSRHMDADDFTSLQARQPKGAPMQLKPVEAGAATSVYGLTSPELEGRGGLYLEDCHVADISDDPDVRGGVRSYALDPGKAAALWARSEELVGESFR